jgi:hypothetical protein
VFFGAEKCNMEKNGGIEKITNKENQPDKLVILNCWTHEDKTSGRVIEVK